jgi:hypothetical protein
VVVDRANKFGSREFVRVTAYHRDANPTQQFASQQQYMPNYAQQQQRRYYGS